MAGLFKQSELRNFSFNDKLKWAIMNITNCLNLIEVEKVRVKEYPYPYNSIKYKLHSFSRCSFIIPKKLPESIFNDLKFWIEDDVCFIELGDAKYQFHLSMALRVKQGILKAIR
jgi:hypothetical protein